MGGHILGFKSEPARIRAGNIMGKKLLTTPRSKVRSAIRQLFLRSRERAAAIKRDKYTCQLCFKKQSKRKGFEQKIECHHKLGIGNWDMVIDLIFKEILCSPDNLETICPDCHKAEHKPEIDFNDLPF